MYLIIIICFVCTVYITYINNSKFPNEPVLNILFNSIFVGILIDIYLKLDSDSGLTFMRSYVLFYIVNIDFHFGMLSISET